MDKYPKKLSSRSVTFTLSVPTVLGGMGILLCGFIFVFILGLLLGSGYDIEERIPALETVLPDKNPAPPPAVIAADMESQGQEGAASTGEAAEGKDGAGATAQAGTSRDLLEQTDLEYRDSLKSEKTAQERKRKAEAEKKKKAEAERKKAEEDKKKKAEAERKKKEARQKEERFRFVYQAASYRGQTYADKFTEKLKKEGVRARTSKSVDKGGTWFRVLVDLTGTPSDAEDLRRKMQAQGVSKMVLLSKKPLR